MYESVVKRIDNNLKTLQIYVRPNAGNGLWLCCLVPLSFLLNVWKHNKIQSFDYKLNTIIAFGLLIEIILIFIKLQTDSNSRNRLINFVKHILPFLVTSFLIWICLKQTPLFSVTSGFFTTITFNSFYFYLLKLLPKSFTLGEATITAQSFTLFFYNSIISFTHNYQITTMDKMIKILQIGLFFISIFFLLTLAVNYFRNNGKTTENSLFNLLFAKPTVYFYILLICFTFAIIFYQINNEFAIIVLLDFVFNTWERIFITILYVGVMGLTGCAIVWQINNDKMASTSVRKIFHIILLIVFIPGLLYECTYLFLATGVIFAVMLVFEAARMEHVWPVDEFLEQTVKSFIDEKDAGLIALTPIYLLAGFTLPMWLHPSPCDITDSTTLDVLPLLAGVLSVGIGDTTASVFGSKFGRFKWKNSPKTIEGTVASIISQFLFIYLLQEFFFINLNLFLLIKIIAGITISSIIEAKTDQVDNLVLPFITFIIFSI